MTPHATASRLANERLARSRDSLRQAIRASHPPAATKADRPDGLNALAGLKALPGLDVLLVALRLWWAQQPLHLAGLAASEAAIAVLKPLAQRHPVPFVLGGAALGALLVRLKPWRWLPAAAILSGLIPPTIGKLLGGLPLQSSLATLASTLKAQTPNKPPT